MTIRIFIKTLSTLVVCLLTPAFQPLQAACPAPTGVSLQILGSGGPIADDGRASSSYLVWLDGKARVLIDAGGGSFLRFGEAGAGFADLDFIGLSHLHTDHSAALPALLKSGNFSGRDRPLPIAGPNGEGVFPGLEGFLSAMLNREAGAYGYLASYLDGAGDKPMLTPREVSAGAPALIWSNEIVAVDGMRVPHGIVPAVSFRVRAGDTTIVFGSDQNGSDPAFVEFAKDASALVMHMVVPEDVAGVGRRLHAPPSVIGEIAGQAQPGTLVLSHFMARSLENLEGNVALVKKGYRGEIVLADDLVCVIP
jgi:ribonuclease BN (tRNA processing enzyme)